MFGSIRGHIGSNLWLWTGLSLALGAVAMIARGKIGTGHHLGDLASLALMFGGTTLCLISQRGLPVAASDEDDAIA